MKRRLLAAACAIASVAACGQQGKHAESVVYRRLEGGMSPELELLRFLRAKGFANVPSLLGWYDYSGQSLEELQKQRDRQIVQMLKFLESIGLR